MHRIPCLVAFAAFVGCSSPAPTSPDAATDAPGDVSDAQHAIIAKIALATDPDGQHVTFGTQNGSTVSLLVTDLAGKTVYWATTEGGVPLSNAPMPIDQGITTLDTDLTTTFTTAPHYADGPYEVSCVISVTGTPPPNIPASGDLAAFDNSTPPAGQPPPTGQSVRFTAAGADATKTLTNQYFIRFGSLASDAGDQ
jgi:hypothetical protein